MEANAAVRGLVVFGVPMYNGSPYLEETLESLLAQSYRDLRVVLVDDRSIDATEEIARRFVAADERVSYVRNDRRLGMVGNWCHAFELAMQRHPTAQYFAWGSDHDIWHPEWLGACVDALAGNEAAVLSYPMSTSIDESGDSIPRSLFSFDTEGVRDPRRRWALTWSGMSAGNMVYGLMRPDALRACGVYRKVVEPDRLLMMELALRGEFVQVPEILWCRRRLGPKPTVERQLRSFFPRGGRLHAAIPWPATHAWQLATHYVLDGGTDTIGRLRAARLVLDYRARAARLQADRRWRGPDGLQHGSRGARRRLLRVAGSAARAAIRPRPPAPDGKIRPTKDPHPAHVPASNDRR